MIIWCNFHGGCISAFGLISLYIIGEFLNKKPVKKYIYVLFACFAALFVNPYGINYVKFLFYAALMKRELIAEWNCSFLPQYTFMYLKYKFYLLFIILVEILYFIKLKINYKTLDKTKFLIVLVFAVLSVIKVRFQTFFVLSAGTLLYDEFYYIYNSFKESLKSKLLNNGKINNGYSEEKISNPVPDSDSSAQSQCSSALSEYLFGYSKVKEIIIYTLILLMSVYLIFIKNNEIRITESEYPRFAIEFIKINNIEGNLFINFNWGSYAAYKLYPDNLIVMDGRYEEVYNPILLNEMRDFHMLKGNWDKIIKDYKTDVMIIEKKYPVYEKIIENENWALIFENNLSGVFVPANKLQKEYKYPPANDNYYNSTMFLTDIEFK